MKFGRFSDAVTENSAAAPRGNEERGGGGHREVHAEGERPGHVGRQHQVGHRQAQRELAAHSPLKSDIPRQVRIQLQRVTEFVPGQRDAHVADVGHRVQLAAQGLRQVVRPGLGHQPRFQQARDVHRVLQLVAEDGQRMAQMIHAVPQGRPVGKRGQPRTHRGGRKPLQALVRPQRGQVGRRIGRAVEVRPSQLERSRFRDHAHW